MTTLREKELNTIRQRRRRLRIKNDLIKNLGGKCVICGSTHNLEFDHVDSKTKLFAISDGIANKSEADIRSEVDKCQLLCKTCHKRKTDRCGENKNRKLTLNEYTAIKELYLNGGVTQQEIATKFGISQHHVSTIVHKK